MFNVKEFLESDFRTDYAEEKIGNETFLIRKMDGYERLVFQDFQKGSEAVIYALGHCLLDGNTKQPIGEDNAKEFIRRHDALANAVATRIFGYIGEQLKAEKEAWGLAEKNSPETSGNGDTADIADATV